LIGIDTSVLVRYFAQDDAHQFSIARRLLQRELSEDAPGHVSLVALAEMAWVLRSRYRSTRDELITIVESLLCAPNIRMQDEAAVWLALDDCERAGVGVADALIAAVDQHHGCSHTATFDHKAMRITSMKLLS
jgi:predicted nucleic-acid-binding protein